MRDALEHQPTDANYYLRSIKEATKDLSSAMFGRNPNRGSVDCSTNPQKADLVAEALINDWTMAKHIAEDNGARFFAFLQPMAFLSKTRLSHIQPAVLDPKIGAQYETVYPLIRAKMKEHAIGNDLSDILDIDDYFYIDFCHVSPNGKAIRKAMTTSTKISGRGL